MVQFRGEGRFKSRDGGTENIDNNTTIRSLRYRLNIAYFAHENKHHIIWLYYLTGE